MDMRIVTTAHELSQYLPALQRAPVIAVDAETTGLDPRNDRMRLLQLAAEGLPVLVIDAFRALPEGAPLLRDALTGSHAVKVFQNAKFDLQFLLALGIAPRPIFDTMLASQLIGVREGARRHHLAALAERFLGERLDKQEQTSDWSGPLRESQIRYAAEDAAILLRLRRAMLPHLRQEHLVRIADIELRCARAVAAMEYRGIHVDAEAWRALRDRTMAERERALDALYAVTGRPAAQLTLWGEEQTLNYNLESNAFVLDLLHRAGIDAKGTSKRDLYAWRDHPLVRALNAYRAASKALSSSIEPIEAVLDASSRVYPRYGQISAFSGRMSCSSPNIQQIPRAAAFRACFTAPEGRSLVIADYSQIELRVAAEVSGDARMLDAYRRGEDLHRLTASIVAGVPIEDVDPSQRQAAKAVNFGLIYGMGGAGLQQYAQQSYGVSMTLEEAHRFRDRFFAAYPGLRAWHVALSEGHAREGRTLGGRRYAFSREPSLPEMSNTPVQGTAADILKHALGLLMDRLEGVDAFPVAVVHDEIVMECAQADAQEVVRRLERAMVDAGADLLTRVPVVAEAKVCGSWAGK